MDILIKLLQFILSLSFFPTYLDNPKRLTVIQGINDCIVAESGNVLLICKKEDEQRIKQFVADAQMKYGKEFN